MMINPAPENRLVGGLFGLTGALVALLVSHSGSYSLVLQKLGLATATAPYWWAAIWILLLGIGCGLVFSSLRPAGGVLLFVAVSIIWGVGTLLLQTRLSVDLPTFAALQGVLLGWIGFYSYRAIWLSAGQRHRSRRFGYQLSPIQIQQFAQDPGFETRLADRRFAAICYLRPDQIDTYAEKMEPREFIELLAGANQLFKRTTQVALGIPETGLNGAMQAIWGSPREVDNPAMRACRSALELQKELQGLAAGEARNSAVCWHFGLHGGQVVCGDVDSVPQARIAGFGAVSTAARQLQELNPLYGTTILISESIFQKTDNDTWTRPLGKLRLHGEKDPQTIYQLIGLRSEALGMSRSELLAQFSEGLRLYLQRDWDLAANRFRQALQIDGGDEPSRIFLLRCQTFLQEPPPTEWDGVFARKSAN